MSETLVLDGIRYHPPGIDWLLAIDELPVNSGELMGVIGPNGAGKSTLARIAVGILTPEAGTVRLMGNDIATLDRREIARTLGYLPQIASGGDHTSRCVRSRRWDVILISPAGDSCPRMTPR